LCRMEIPNTTPDKIRSAVGRVLDLIHKEIVLTEKDRFEVKLIVNELLANGFFHGNGGDVSKGLTLTVILDDNYMMTVEVQDQGAGFDPAHTHIAHGDEEHGRGLMLIQALSDRVDFKKRGSCIAVQKRLAVG
jgi:anti-sigma regulatory factor (Ser/Thr protein kinase)